MHTNKNPHAWWRLFEPEPFHTGNYTEITQQCLCVFYKQKSPREEAILYIEDNTI